MTFHPKHPKWDQNLQFTSQSETTSIPVTFTWESPREVWLLLGVLGFFLPCRLCHWLKNHPSRVCLKLKLLLFRPRKPNHCYTRRKDCLPSMQSSLRTNFTGIRRERRAFEKSIHSVVPPGHTDSLENWFIQHGHRVDKVYYSLPLAPLRPRELQGNSGKNWNLGPVSRKSR